MQCLAISFLDVENITFQCICKTFGEEHCHVTHCAEPYRISTYTTFTLAHIHSKVTRKDERLGTFIFSPKIHSENVLSQALKRSACNALLAEMKEQRSPGCSIQAVKTQGTVLVWLQRVFLSFLYTGIRQRFFPLYYIIRDRRR